MLKKMLPWVIMIFVVITLIVVAAFLIWNNLFAVPGASPGELARQRVEGVQGSSMPPEKIRELTVEINDVLTNLATGDFIKVSFAFELSNENVKEEFTLKEFKVRAIINQTLADLSPDDVRGSVGIDNLGTTLMNKINQQLDEGAVRQVNITALVIS